MANQITGRILIVNPTQIVPCKDGRSQFTKRELILDCARFDPNTGQKYENTPMLEFSGQNCDLLNGFQPGQLVTISFELQGRASQMQDGTIKYFTHARAYRIEAKAERAQQPFQQPAAPYAQQYPQYTGGEPQQGYQQRSNRYPPQTDPQTGLPF